MSFVGFAAFEAEDATLAAATTRRAFAGKDDELRAAVARADAQQRAAEAAAALAEASERARREQEAAATEATRVLLQRLQASEAATSEAARTFDQQLRDKDAEANALKQEHREAIGALRSQVELLTSALEAERTRRVAPDLQSSLCPLSVAALPLLRFSHLFDAAPGRAAQGSNRKLLVTAAGSWLLPKARQRSQ